MAVKAAHHVTILTFEPQPLLDFFTGVLGYPIQQEFVAPGASFATLLRVPEAGDVACWILGEGNAGLIEVCQLHESLRGQVEPGVRLCAFITRNFDTVVEGSQGRDGVTVSEPVAVPEVGLESLLVTAGGADLEFVRFP
jgi:catechol 2,3-dioxygenase-like lactoylglutathione lyase family enzyme